MQNSNACVCVCVCVGTCLGLINDIRCDSGAQSVLARNVQRAAGVDSRTEGMKLKCLIALYCG